MKRGDVTRVVVEAAESALAEFRDFEEQGGYEDGTADGPLCRSFQQTQRVLRKALAAYEAAPDVSVEDVAREMYRTRHPYLRVRWELIKDCAKAQDLSLARSVLALLEGEG